MARAYLGLGSDLGNRVEWLRRGVRALRRAGLRLGSVSPIYLTEPVGDPDLPWFLNCALEIVEPPPPGELIAICLEAERACGRRRVEPGLRARTLDVDLLLYDRLTLEGPALTVPHPRLHGRRFALRPLADIAPDAVHPISRTTIAELLAELQSTERVWLLAPFPSIGDRLG